MTASLSSVDKPLDKPDDPRSQDNAGMGAGSAADKESKDQGRVEE